MADVDHELSAIRFVVVRMKFEQFIFSVNKKNVVGENGEYILSEAL